VTRLIALDISETGDVFVADQRRL